MVDLKDLAENASQRAALNAGKDMARRALEDLTLSPEEKQKRDEERAAGKKKTLLKIIAVVVVGGVGLLVVMSLLAKLWMYAIAALVLGGVGTAGYFVLKPKLAALKKKLTARSEEKRLLQEADEKAQAERERERAAAAAVVAQKQKLDDELAALKKRSQG